MSIVISLRVEPDIKNRLDSLCKATDREASWHFRRAIERYLEQEAWQVPRREWVLLGAFEWGTRDQIKHRLEKYGIRVAGCVKKDTQFLVKGRLHVSSMKLVGAMRHGVPIIDEATMWSMLNRESLEKGHGLADI